MNLMTEPQASAPQDQVLTRDPVSGVVFQNALSTPQRPAMRIFLGIMRSFAVSLTCFLLGLIVFVVIFSTFLDENHEHIPDRLSFVLFADLVLGVLTNLAAGPLRNAGAWNYVLIGVGSLSGTSLPAVAVGLSRIGKRRELRLDLFCLLIVAVGVVVADVVFSMVDPHWRPQFVIEVGVSLIFAVACLLWGRVKGTRLALITSLRLQAATDQRERDAMKRERDAVTREHRALVAQAQATQRAAIARDMHDSLSHHLSLIAMHSGALAYRDDIPPERMKEVLSLLRDEAQAANTDLRQALTTLRSDDGSTMPTATSIDAEVAHSRMAGQDVILTWSGLNSETLSAEKPVLSSALARIVRELIANARKHAPGNLLELSIARSADNASGSEVVLTAWNRTSIGASRSESLHRGAGLGLTGIREQARLLGGVCTVKSPHDGETRDGGLEEDLFIVSVSLPWGSSESEGS
mgnify:FL=1